MSYTFSLKCFFLIPHPWNSKRIHEFFSSKQKPSLFQMKFKITEKIWEDSLDFIPSPSPPIIGGKVYLRCKAKHCWALSFENKKFFDITHQCFALLPQENFPGNNSNFHWRWRDWIQAIFLNLLYFIEWADWFPHPWSWFLMSSTPSC